MIELVKAAGAVTGMSARSAPEGTSTIAGTPRAALVLDRSTRVSTVVVRVNTTCNPPGGTPLVPTGTKAKAGSMAKSSGDPP